MRNPLWRLRTLPWGTLFQNALLTTAIATLLDIAFLFLIQLLGRQGVDFVIPGGGMGLMLLLLLVGGGIGALGVILMDRLFRQVFLDIATLWALVGCLAVVLFVKGLLPVPAALVGISRLQLVGIILGLFAQGRAYWRR